MGNISDRMQELSDDEKKIEKLEKEIERLREENENTFARFQKFLKTELDLGFLEQKNVDRMNFYIDNYFID